MPSWTTSDIPAQTGKFAVITGANSGVGWETARALARAGATTALACRDAAKAESARRRILDETPDAKVRTYTLDLANLGSIRGFAERLLGEAPSLDILVNNAAVMGTPERRTTADGFELQFGVNHLGHFALTGLLMPALLSARGARIVTVASIAHKRGVMRFDDLNLEKAYDPWLAYRQAKLANLLFALELQRRLERNRADVLSVAAHPGISKTNIVANSALESWKKFWMQKLLEWFAQPGERGALPILYAATAPAARGGCYYGPNGFQEMRGYPVEVKAAPQAYDEGAAARLWSVSERLTGVQAQFSGFQ